MSEVKKEIDLEIAHVLFVDIVGYSKLLINDQRRLLEVLNQLVRGTEQFRVAEQSGRLISIPTGDGMALVFYQSPEAPVECALELARADKQHPELQLRMGVHSGPVSGVVDVNGRANLAGAGINMAQRVMDCGDAGHILLSKHVAEDLEQYGHWHPHLHDLGETEVKHGVRLRVVNLYTDELGNPVPPEKFKTAAAALPAAPMEHAKRKIPWREVVLAVLLLGAIVAAGFYFRRKPGASAPDQVAKTLIAAPAATNSVPEKSIAVLPFENLSSDKENAYFADGVQDEILTDLARIADLKVISRSSVMHYKSGVERNLRKIGEELGVAHLLEGSVQRATNRIRVNAQLIDARADAHLWAQTYDRDLADVFAIQSEIAKAIADQLQAKISSKEEAALQSKPTKDLIAYDLYLRALEIERNIVSSVGVIGADETKREIPLLEEATQRDPAFVPALCALAHAHLYLYWVNDQNDARLASAEEALDEAARIQPDAGEVHLARALLLYWGKRDYEPALGELASARSELPNDARVLFWTGVIKRRQGKFEDAIRHYEQVLATDPRNISVVSDLAFTYSCVRRYRDSAKIIDSALVWKPLDFGLRYLRALVDVAWKADLGLWKALVISGAAKAANASDLADARFDLAIKERDYHTAEQVLAGHQVTQLNNDGFFVPKEWNEAIIARGLGDQAKANGKFLAARYRAEAGVRDRLQDGKSLVVLAEIDAALGRKEDALREGQHATELLPVTRDALIGAEIANRLAGIYTQVGMSNRALDDLEKASKLPGVVTYGSLKLDAVWDPLRGDPRFEKIVASLAPKE